MAHSIGAGRRTRLSWARIGAGTGAGVLVAVAACESIYLLASTAGWTDASARIPSLLGTGPLSPASVAVTVLVATIGAGLVLAGFMLTTRHPVRNFRVLATVLALLSLLMPATIPGPPASMRLVLAAMHVAVWAATTWVLAGLAGREVGR